MTKIRTCEDCGHVFTETIDPDNMLCSDCMAELWKEGETFFVYESQQEDFLKALKEWESER